MPRDDDPRHRPAPARGPRRDAGELAVVRGAIADLTRAAAAIDRVLGELRARAAELQPGGALPPMRERLPSAHEIAEEILDYLEENTSPGIELPERVSRPRLPPPPPAPAAPHRTDSERARIAARAVMSEDKAQRWDDFWKTWRKVILTGIATAGVMVVGRIIEAAIRGHW